MQTLSGLTLNLKKYFARNTAGFKQFFGENFTRITTISERKHEIIINHSIQK